MAEELWACAPCQAGDCPKCDIVDGHRALQCRPLRACACPRCGPQWITLVGSAERPSGQVLRDVADRLVDFRQTLPPEHQRLLDALLLAALRPEWHEDVQPYWAAAQGRHPHPTGPRPARSAPSPEVLRLF